MSREKQLKLETIEIGGGYVMRCKLCNEAFEQVELEFGEVYRVDDEYWHAACYAEYFDEVEAAEKI